MRLLGSTKHCTSLLPPSCPRVIHSPPPPSPGLGVTQQGEPRSVLHPNLLCISRPFASLSFSCLRKTLAAQGSQPLQDGNRATKHIHTPIYLWQTHSLQEDCCFLKCPARGWHVPLQFLHMAMACPVVTPSCSGHPHPASCRVSRPAAQMICRSLCFHWLIPWESNHHLPTINMATMAQLLPGLSPSSFFECHYTLQPP